MEPRTSSSTELPPADAEVEALAQREAAPGNPWAVLYLNARGPEWDRVIDSVRSTDEVHRKTTGNPVRP